MKKWMLVCCCERDIETPEFFDTKGEAQEAMCKDFACMLGLTSEEVKKIMFKGHNVDEDASIFEDYAWADKHISCDWKIFNIVGRV
jgi:hypothetical protein